MIRKPEPENWRLETVQLQKNMRITDRFQNEIGERQEVGKVKQRVSSCFSTVNPLRCRAASSAHRLLNYQLYLYPKTQLVFNLSEL